MSKPAFYGFIVCALIIGSLFGVLIGRANGVSVVQGVIANNCDKVKGFAVGSKVYTCERVKKESK